MICDTLSSQYAFTHQFWNSYLKEYRRYAPHSMQFRKLGHRSSSRSQLPNYGTRHLLTSSCIHTPNWKFLPQKILELCSGHNYSKNIGQRSRSQHRKMVCNTPKIHPHIKFGIPTSKNIGAMHRTRSGPDGHCDYYND